MKKIASLFSIFILFSSIAFGQGCLPDGITFMSQDSIDNFQIYFPGCTEIDGNLFITGDNITNLNGLSVLTAIYGDLRIENCDYITTLNGLENVITIGGYLYLAYNDSLANLSGLNSLSNVGSISLSHLSSFTSFTPLENITHLGGSLSVHFCNELINFSELSSLSTINSSINVQNNNSLINFEGLNNLTSVGNGLLINGNSSLINFEGLNSLTSIGGGLTISYCPSLENLNGLNNVSSIGYAIEITNNVNLNSLSALINVNSNLYNLILYSNNTLTSLYGLDNLGFIDNIPTIYIYDNTSLSYCKTESICEAVALYGNIIQVYNNAPGCSSIFEIQDACQTGLQESDAISNISLYIDQANNELIINKNNIYPFKEINIYNLAGQKVLQRKEFLNGIDVSGLNKGFYIVEVKTENFIYREKILIQ